MTEQQTAATDNALVEADAREVLRADAMSRDGYCHEMYERGWVAIGCAISSMLTFAKYRPEAAERIKSLLAENEYRLSFLHLQDKHIAELEADRQRMREALGRVPLPAPTKTYTPYELRVLGWIRTPLVQEALNHASKEANDG